MDEKYIENLTIKDIVDFKVNFANPAYLIKLKKQNVSLSETYDAISEVLIPDEHGMVNVGGNRIDANALRDIIDFEVDYATRAYIKEIESNPEATYFDGIFDEEKRKIIAEKDKILDEMDKIAADRDMIISELNMIIAEKKKLDVEKKRFIAEKGTIAKKDREIAALKDKISQLESN